MTLFDLKPAAACRFDCVSLGEVMLRLDPGDGRVRTTRAFRVWEGGGEYNVARGLRRTFGLRTALVSAFADNEVGRLLEDLLLQGGVDLSHVKWVPYDGVGRAVRNGLNFTERGFGVRGAVGMSDRGHTAASQLKPGDVDWDHLFRTLGVRWFHTGGIFAALSESTAALAAEGLAVAKRHGTVTSYDLNYRPSLWQAAGGQPAARRVNQAIAPVVDVMLGNEEDFTACLGLEVPGTAADLKHLDHAGYRAMVVAAAAAYPNLKCVATTLRTVHSATVNDWSALCHAGGTVHESARRPGLEVFDRVGGGDSFAAGLIYGFLRGFDPAQAPGLRGRPRGAGHDHPGRHGDGVAGRGREAGSGRGGPGRAVTPSSVPDRPAGRPPYRRRGPPGSVPSGPGPSGGGAGVETAAPNSSTPTAAGSPAGSMTRSRPGPPVTASAPAPVYAASSPAPRSITSSPDPPYTVSLPAPAVMTSAPDPPKMMSAAAPPVSVSLPVPPMIWVGTLAAARSMASAPSYPRATTLRTLAASTAATAPASVVIGVPSARAYRPLTRVSVIASAAAVPWIVSTSPRRVAVSGGRLAERAQHRGGGGGRRRQGRPGDFGGIDRVGGGLVGDPLDGPGDRVRAGPAERDVGPAAAGQGVTAGVPVQPVGGPAAD